MLGDYGMDYPFHKLDTLKEEEDTLFDLDINYEQLHSSSGDASLPIDNFHLDSSSFFLPCHQLSDDFSFVSCGKQTNATPEASPQIPTPPQSPFSNEAMELDNLLAVIPEIFNSTSPHKLSNVDDILRDLQTSSSPLIEIDPLSIPGGPLSSVEIWDKSRTISDSDNEPPRPIKKDSMWGAGVPFSAYEEHTKINLKARTFSESSDDFKHHSCGFSDHDENEYFPDTPCGSDEDSSNSPQHYNKYGSAVSSEHNYCEMAPAKGHNTCKATRDATDRLIPELESEILNQNSIENETDSEEDIEVDVVSINDAATPLLSSLVGLPGSILPSSAPTISSTSADVKRQLQAALHESIRNKRGRGSGRGRPPKVRTELDGSVLKGVQHKSMTYSKRMRTDEMSMSRRRKTTALDPDDDVEKRSNHNIMERNRRVNIKNLFDELRLSVSEIRNNERSSKVLILSKAREQIKVLEAKTADRQYEVECHIRLNEYLKTKYNWLKNYNKVKEESFEDMML